jgi:hypothetical protein
VVIRQASESFSGQQTVVPLLILKEAPAPPEADRLSACARKRPSRSLNDGRFDTCAQKRPGQDYPCRNPGCRRLCRRLGRSRRNAQRLLGAVQTSQAAKDQFVSVIAGTVPVYEYFDPENTERIMAGAATAV